MTNINSIDDVTGQSIKEKIRNDSNPGTGLTHNKGRPKEAPYASTENVQQNRAATFLTNCAKENRASLACIERNYQNRAACSDFFQAYKDCRKKENDERKAANAKLQGDGKSGGW
eukprot:CAMPEP_0197188532 /NCGR_PEP_ID=MMETSP1423-20130617/17963_1 /TAXON_ID=476441 /ORGANISM="Pseudo-nitzschia heimii, Strain UNC1101" /LENGTH=114 /DNA_ID=CAMNT_0042640387 /DNA_START=15 /DNA_END=356 /DNA_ORIENTATION=+